MPPPARFLSNVVACRTLGRKERIRAARRARRAARAAAMYPAGDAGGVDDLAGDLVEVDLGGGAMMVGTPNFMREFMAPAAERLKGTRAKAKAENQKASAPCEACGRLMPAAERCAACRENGVWYCAGCHARLEGRTGVGPVFD